MTKSAKRPKKTTDNDFKKLIEQYKDEKGWKRRQKYFLENRNLGKYLT